MQHWMRVLLWAVCASLLVHGCVLDWMRRPQRAPRADLRPLQLRWAPPDVPAAPVVPGLPDTAASRQAASARPAQEGRSATAQRPAGTRESPPLQRAPDDQLLLGPDLSPALSVLRTASPAEAQVALRLALADALQRLPARLWPQGGDLLWCDYAVDGRLLAVRGEQAAYPDLLPALGAVAVPAVLSGQAFALDLLIER